MIWWILLLCDLSTLPWASCCLQSRGSQTYTMLTSCRRHILRNRKIPFSEDLGSETGTVFLPPNCIDQSHVEEQHISSVSYIPHPQKATKTWHFLWPNPATNDGPGRFIHFYALAAHPHTSYLTTVWQCQVTPTPLAKEDWLGSLIIISSRKAFSFIEIPCPAERGGRKVKLQIGSKTASSLAREASLSPGEQDCFST